jgi:hypothetical protein
MTVKNGAFGLCACVSGEVTRVHSAHSCRNERGSSDFAQGALSSLRQVLFRPRSFTMTRALNYVPSEMLSQCGWSLEGGALERGKALDEGHPRRPGLCESL